LCSRVLNQARVHDLPPGLSYSCCFILCLYFYNNVLHLTSIWLEYHSLFQDMCFCNQVWGYDMPHIYSFRYSYPLTVMFNSIHTLGQCVNQVWGYGRTKLLVFLLAAFCWTKSLLCNVAAFTRMLLYPESTLQLCSSRRFCEVFKDLFWFPVSRPDDVVFRPDAHQSATSVRTTRSFCPDAHQCLEASNSTRWHPS